MKKILQPDWNIALSNVQKEWIELTLVHKTKEVIRIDVSYSNKTIKSKLDIEHLTELNAIDGNIMLRKLEECFIEGQDNLRLLVNKPSFKREGKHIIRKIEPYQEEITEETKENWLPELTELLNNGDRNLRRDPFDVFGSYENSQMSWKIRLYGNRGEEMRKWLDEETGFFYSEDVQKDSCIIYFNEKIHPKLGRNNLVKMYMHNFLEGKGIIYDDAE